MLYIYCPISSISFFFSYLSILVAPCAHLPTNVFFLFFLFFLFFFFVSLVFLIELGVFHQELIVHIQVNRKEPFSNC